MQELAERSAVNISADLPADTIARRWREVNVILRTSILTSLDMRLEAALDLLCDQAAEIVRFERAAAFLWKEEDEPMQVRVTRNIEAPASEAITRANLLNFWCARLRRPLLVAAGQHSEVDLLLNAMRCRSVLVVPLFVRQRVIGSLQLYGAAADSFAAEDAQLLWMLALVGETLVARDHSNEALMRFAFTDYLTGLKTRGFFEQQLDLELKRCERHRTSLALLMIDVDFFKQLNDTHGHSAGDQALREIGALLVKDMREVDTVARYGGEEFSIILPETGPHGGLLVAQRLRRSVESARFVLGPPERKESLSISNGVAVYAIDARFKNELIQAADAALYEAKARGRNRVVLHGEMEKGQREEAV